MQIGRWTRDAQGDTLFEQNYDYLGDGQRDSVVEKRYDGVASQPFSTVKIDWSYDAMNRLVEETRDADPSPADGVDNFGTQEAGDYTETFALDLSGNRSRRVLDHFDAAKDETIAYAYNERDQLMSEDSTIAANDKSYAYDGNGSTTQVTKNGVSTYYLWDLRNRMAGISLDNDGTSTDAGETTYTYDHNGVRVRQATVGGDTTVYVNDAANPTGYTKAIEEKVAPQAAPTRSYVIGLGVEAVAQGPAGAVEVAYQVHDGHGSTRLLLASDGDVLEAYDYTAFGDPLLIDDAGAITGEGDAAAAASRTPWLFAGDGLYDAASGWTYHLARYRDGHRFVSFDSFEADPTSPAGLHKYAYGGANPIYYIDASGNSLLGTLGSMAIWTGNFLKDVGVSMMVLGLGMYVASGVVYHGASLAMQIWGPSDWLLKVQREAEIGMYLGLGTAFAGAGIWVSGAALTSIGGALSAMATAAAQANSPPSDPTVVRQIRQLNEKAASLDCEAQGLLRQAAKFQDPAMKDSYWKAAEKLFEEADEIDEAIEALGGKKWGAPYDGQ